MARVEILGEGLDHPEGVRARAASQVGSTGGWTLGLALDGGGNIYACDPKRRIVARMSPSGGVEEYSAGVSERGMLNPNYPTFDARIFRLAPVGRPSYGPTNLVILPTAWRSLRTTRRCMWWSPLAPESSGSSVVPTARLGPWN